MAEKKSQEVNKVKNNHPVHFYKTKKILDKDLIKLYMKGGYKL